MMKITELPMVCPRCPWKGTVYDCDANDDGDLLCPECQAPVVSEDTSDHIMKQKACIIFRSGDSYLTQIDAINTPTTLGKRMWGGGFLICHDHQWHHPRILIINLQDVSCIELTCEQTEL